MLDPLRAIADRALLGVFGASSAVHLAALLADADLVAAAVKPLPVLALAGYVGLRKGSKLLVAGLLFSAAGDAALEADGLFLVGMALFALAHACFVAAFVRSGRRIARRALAAYLAVWAGLAVALWPGLGDLRIPVTAYSLLLTATAVTAAGAGPRVGLGGGLFLLSDALIATRLAGWPQLPGAELWIMLTYLAAQYLFATSRLRPRSGRWPLRPRRSRHAASV